MIGTSWDKYQPNEIACWARIMWKFLLARPLQWTHILNKAKHNMRYKETPVIIYTIAIDLYISQSLSWETSINSAVNIELTNLIHLTREALGIPDTWSILSHSYGQSIIRVCRAFSKHNLRDSKRKEERKMRWLTNGFYSWTEVWRHTCTVVPVSGAKIWAYTCYNPIQLSWRNWILGGIQHQDINKKES